MILSTKSKFIFFQTKKFFIYYFLHKKRTQRLFFFILYKKNSPAKTGESFLDNKHSTLAVPFPGFPWRGR